jgi:hypothetical protein
VGEHEQFLVECIAMTVGAKMYVGSSARKKLKGRSSTIPAALARAWVHVARDHHRRQRLHGARVEARTRSHVSTTQRQEKDRGQEVSPLG